MISNNQKPFSDSYRLQFHLTPSQGLLNDPNGFVEYDGTYHLFYQWNPYAPTHERKHWGHYTSKDLARWDRQQPVLSPENWYDKNGCYSGSAIVVDHSLFLFYTGNVKDLEGRRFTYQCRAVSSDGITFQKEGPILPLPSGYTSHFRDPKVWKRNGTWYMVVGAQGKDYTGKVAFFSSTDFTNWSHHGSIAGSFVNGLDYFGYMWECPDLFYLDGKDILLVSPQGMEAEGDLYNNLYQSGYFTGTLNYENKTYKHGGFTELDYGFDFYAPQTMLDSKGRRIMIAWMGMPEETEKYHPTLLNNWIHAMTIPRELKLVNGALQQHPVEELKLLRNNQQTYHHSSLSNEGVNFPLSEGKTLEIFLECPHASFTMNIRNTAEIHYDVFQQTFIFERISLKNTQKEERKTTVKELKTLHIFLDTSSIEIFINNGEYVFTSRFFPSEKHQKLALHPFEKSSFTVTTWEIGSIWN